jgi:hypothetical protein
MARRERAPLRLPPRSGERTFAQPRGPAGGDRPHRSTRNLRNFSSGHPPSELRLLHGYGRDHIERVSTTSGRDSTKRLRGHVARRQARQVVRAFRRSRLRPALDSCGCQMGATFLAFALPVALTWYLWRWQMSSLSLLGALAWVAGWTFAAGSVGKLLGIVLWRTSRLGRQ